VFSDSEWERLARYLTGDCSPEEREAIEAWIENDPRREARMDELKRIWALSDAEPRPRDLDAAWNDLESRIGREERDDESLRSVGGTDDGHSPRERSPRSRPRGRRSGRGWTSVGLVAVTLLLAGAAAVLFTPLEESSSPPQPRVIATEAGEGTRVQLDDGSTVHLNAKSELTVTPSFGTDRREVHLEGEAYFDVTAGRPFVVNARDTQVRVLGTAFGIRSYTSDDHVSVVVAEGKVGVDVVEDSAPEQTLGSRQRAVVSSTQDIRVTSDVTLAHHLDWREGRLVFQGTPLRSVMRTLERQYEVSTWLLEDSLAHRELTATFADTSLEEVLNVIALSLDLGYRHSDSTVVFGRPGHEELNAPASPSPSSQ